jgi:GNAT superfamily N-acetyltransferase
MLRSIFEYILFAVRIFRDAINHKALLQLFRESVFFAKVVIPGSIDLTTLNDQQNPFQNSDYQFKELGLEDLATENSTFSIRCRHLKAMRKIKRGWRGFVLLKDSTIVGDIWCDTPQNRNAPIRFPDLDVLGITFADGDAYAADMFIDPAYRGKKLAVPFYLSLELKLKREGWRRIYACYYEDNICAKWMHCSLKFKELPKFRESRFFFLTKTYKFFPHRPSANRTYSQNK